MAGRQGKKRLRLTRAWLRWGAWPRVGIGIATAVVIAVLFNIQLLPDRVSLRIGQIAPREVVAHRYVRYPDEVETARLRDLAARSVEPIYARVADAAPQVERGVVAFFDRLLQIHAALRNLSHAATLLGELAAAEGTRDNPYYAELLPTLVKTSITISQPDIAEQFTTGFEPHTPYAQHALIAATATLAEARGDHQAAADGYADAAARWEQFGVTPEHAYALQGHGRCLMHLNQPHEATPVLQHATALSS